MYGAWNVCQYSYNAKCKFRKHGAQVREVLLTTYGAAAAEETKVTHEVEETRLLLAPVIGVL